jgi:hypothetical protein
MQAKRRVVVRRVVAMSHYRSAQIEGLATWRARLRAVWRASLATGRQNDSVTTRRLARFASNKTTRRKGDINIGCVVAIGNATRNVYQISHHTILMVAPFLYF